MIESCPACEFEVRVRAPQMCTLRMSHVPRVNESCPTYEWGMSHIWRNHVLHAIESCPTCECEVGGRTPRMCTLRMSHVPRVNDSCPIYELIMSYIWMSCISHAIESYESCPTYEWFMSHIWRNHVVHMNESCPTCECEVGGRTPRMCTLRMSHVPHMNESCLTYEWVVSHMRLSHMSHVPHLYDSCPTYQGIMSYIRMSHVPHINDLYLTCD